MLGDVGETEVVGEERAPEHDGGGQAGDERGDERVAGRVGEPSTARDGGEPARERCVEDEREGDDERCATEAGHG